MHLKSIVILIIVCFYHPTTTFASEKPIPPKETFAPASPVETRDVVYLKNGSIIRGTVIEMIPDSILRIQTRDGSVFVYSMADVQKIVKEEIAGPPADMSGVAARPVRRAKTQFCPLIGYGTEDWYNVGLGLRLGATLSSGTYIGFTFVYHLGKSEDYSYYNTKFTLGMSTMYLGPELGYDAQASERLIVRPNISFGYFSLMASAEAGGNSSSDSEGRFYFAPGIVFNIIASERTMIGFDGRYVVVTGEGGNEVGAFGAFLSLGIVL